MRLALAYAAVLAAAFLASLPSVQAALPYDPVNFACALDAGAAEPPSSSTGGGVVFVWFNGVSQTLDFTMYQTDDEATTVTVYDRDDTVMGTYFSGPYVSGSTAALTPSQIQQLLNRQFKIVLASASEQRLACYFNDSASFYTAELSPENIVPPQTSTTYGGNAIIDYTASSNELVYHSAQYGMDDSIDTVLQIAYGIAAVDEAVPLGVEFSHDVITPPPVGSPSYHTDTATENMAASLAATTAYFVYTTSDIDTILVRAQLLGVEGLGAPGDACTPGETECTSGFCSDGVCCDADCSAACWSCNNNGTEGSCLPAEAGTDPESDCALTAPESCGTTGVCDGAGACAYYSSATVCTQPSCPSGTTTLNATGYCDGSGTCNEGIQMSCTPYVCDITTQTNCYSTCQTDLQCDVGYTCESNECVPLPPPPPPPASSTQGSAGYAYNNFGEWLATGEGLATTGTLSVVIVLACCGICILGCVIYKQNFMEESSDDDDYGDGGGGGKGKGKRKGKSKSKRHDEEEDEYYDEEGYYEGDENYY